MIKCDIFGLYQHLWIVFNLLIFISDFCWIWYFYRFSKCFSYWISIWSSFCWIIDNYCQRFFLAFMLSSTEASSMTLPCLRNVCWIKSNLNAVWVSIFKRNITTCLIYRHWEKNAFQTFAIQKFRNEKRMYIYTFVYVYTYT